MSAVHRQETLQQLVEALGERIVIVHHDFKRMPNMRIEGHDVRFVPDPQPTGWGDWAMMRAMLKTLQYAVDHTSADWFQLLSPVDLPIRPLSELESLVASDVFDAACDAMPLAGDDNVFMTFAPRVFTDDRSILHKVMWRVRLAYFGKHAALERRSGLEVLVDCQRNARGDPALGARLARFATHAYASFVTRWHYPDVGPLHAGGAWFAGNRKACEWLLHRAAQPDVVKRFEHVFSADEFLPATLFAASGLRIAPGHMDIARWAGSRPVWITPDDLESLRDGGRFFARKFADDPTDPARLAILESTAGVTKLTAAARPHL